MDSNVFRNLFRNILRLRIQNIPRYVESHLYTTKFGSGRFETSFTQQERTAFLLEFKDYLLDHVISEDPNHRFILEDLEKFPFPTEPGCPDQGVLCLDKNDRGLLNILRSMNGTIDADKLVNQTKCSSSSDWMYADALDPVTVNQEKTPLDATLDGVLVQAEIQKIQQLLSQLKKTGYLLLQKHIELDRLKDQYARSIEKEITRLSG